MRSYRVTFLKDLSVNYWGKKGDPRPTFRDVHLKFYPLITSFKKQAKKLKIKYFWHFYEPFIEITWMSDEKQSQALLRYIKTATQRLGIKDLKFERGKLPKGQKCKPGDGFGPDWFHKEGNDREEEFGAKRHAICSDMVDLFHEYHDAIESGYGTNEQMSRCIHTLCNPMGLNYNEEMKICFARGLLCWLLKHFPKHAVWLYVKVFRQRLPK